MRSQRTLIRGDQTSRPRASPRRGLLHVEVLEPRFLLSGADPAASHWLLLTPLASAVVGTRIAANAAAVPIDPRSVQGKPITVGNVDVQLSEVAGGNPSSSIESRDARAALNAGGSEFTGTLPSGNATDLYRVGLEHDIPSLQVTVTWRAGTSETLGVLTVFDAAGDIFAAVPLKSTTSSATLLLKNIHAEPGSALYIGVSSGVDPAAVSRPPATDSLDVAQSSGYRLRISHEASPCANCFSILQSTAQSVAGSDSIVSFVLPTGTIVGVNVLPGSSQGSTASSSPGSPQEHEVNASPTGSVPFPSATSTSSIPFLPAAPPLPLSAPVPAGGIFADRGPTAAPLSRLDAARVDLGQIDVRLARPAQRLTWTRPTSASPEEQNALTEVLGELDPDALPVHGFALNLASTVATAARRRSVHWPKSPSRFVRLASGIDQAPELPLPAYPAGRETAGSSGDVRVRTLSDELAGEIAVLPALTTLTAQVKTVGDGFVSLARSSDTTASPRSARRSPFLFGLNCTVALVVGLFGPELASALHGARLPRREFPRFRRLFRLPARATRTTCARAAR